jgi:hypothetical protein
MAMKEDEYDSGLGRRMRARRERRRVEKKMRKKRYRPNLNEKERVQHKVVFELK